MEKIKEYYSNNVIGAVWDRYGSSEFVTLPANVQSEGYGLVGTKEFGWKDNCFFSSVLIDTELSGKFTEMFYFPYKNCYVEKDMTNKYISFHVSLEGVKGLQKYNGNYKWVNLKAFKFFESRFGKKKAQELMDYMSNYTKAALEVTINSNVVRGYDDTPIESCMQGKGEYYESLKENLGDNLVLCEFRYNGLDGRALLWTLDDGTKVLDRIYTGNHHSFTVAVKQWAKDNGYNYRTEQNYTTHTLFNDGDELKLSIYVGDLEDTPVPYMDTFRYYSDKHLYNYKPGSNYRTLDDTDGSSLGGAGTCCYSCGDRYHSDDMYYVESIDEYVCDCCVDDYPYCVDTDRRVHIDDAYYCETNDEFYERNDYLVEINGSWYAEDDNNIYYCEMCSSYHLENDMCGTYVDGMVCDDCFENYVYCMDVEDYVSRDDAYFCEDNDEYYYDADNMPKEENKEENK